MSPDLTPIVEVAARALYDSDRRGFQARHPHQAPPPEWDDLTPAQKVQIKSRILPAVRAAADATVAQVKAEMRAKVAPITEPIDPLWVSMMVESL